MNNSTEISYKFGLSILLFLLSFSLSAQKGKYAKYFSHHLEKGSKVIAAGTNYTLEFKDHKYIYKLYYPELKQIIQLQTFSDRHLKNLDGLYKEWFDDGTLHTSGSYADNIRQGLWTESTNSSGHYINGERQGLWETKLDSSILSRNYKNNELHGWHLEIKNSDTTRLAHYNMGVQDTLLIEPKKSGVEIMPFIKSCINISSNEHQQRCSQKELLTFMYNNIRYPSFARENDIQGKALIRFVVEKDGSISDVVVLSGVCEDIKKECIRVIKLLDKEVEWHPGMQDGKAVRVQYTLPLRFKLAG